MKGNSLVKEKNFQKLGIGKYAAKNNKDAENFDVPGSDTPLSDNADVNDGVPDFDDSEE